MSLNLHPKLLCGSKGLLLEASALRELRSLDLPNKPRVVPSILLSTSLFPVQLDLHANSEGLPPEASALRELRVLDVTAGAAFDPDALASLAGLQVRHI